MHLNIFTAWIMCFEKSLESDRFCLLFAFRHDPNTKCSSKPESSSRKVKKPA